MTRVLRPHVLGIDDGPFEKHTSTDAPVVGVVTAGADVVEGIAITRFPVDGAGATEFLADWISRLRIAPALQAVVLGGITIAGLGIVDVADLARRTAIAVLSVTRRDPKRERLADALRAARLDDRIAVLEQAPPAIAVDAGVWVTSAGTTPERAAALVQSTRVKAAVPEALRLAHLIARALVLGESRGRV